MIEIRDAAHHYGSRVALGGISATLRSQRVALLGPNGAGKSTLIRLLVTLTPLQAGAINVDGCDISVKSQRLRLRNILGYVPQSMDLPPGYTCAEFIAYAAWMRGEKKPRDHVQRCLSAVGLHERRDERIQSLSGGMRQRLCVAQALVNRPSLLIVDEPSVGLDPQQRVQLRETLRSLDCQLLLATHLVDDVAGLAEEVLVLDEGQVAFHGSIQQLCAGEEVTAAAVEKGYLRCVADRER